MPVDRDPDVRRNGPRHGQSDPPVADDNRLNQSGIVENAPTHTTSAQQITQAPGHLCLTRDAIADGIVFIDSSGRILAVNKAVTDIFGYSQKELIGRDFGVLIPESCRPAGDDSPARPRQAGPTEVVGAIQELKGLSRDGRVFPLKLAVIALQENAGETRYLGTLRDLTARKQSEAISETVESLVRAERLSKTGSGGFDLKTRTVYWTPGTYFIHDLDPSDQRGFEKYIDHLWENMHPAEREAIHVATTDGTPFDLELPRLTAKGRLIWLHTRGEPVVRDGKIVGLTGHFQDITARREAEDKLRKAQKMEAVGQLTGGIAHDFNNLLSVIIGSLDLATAQVGDGSPAHAPIARALDAALHGSKLVAQLLAFSRQQTLAPEAVDVNRLIINMEALLRHCLGETITVTSKLAGGLDLAMVDPTQFDTAILNLSINARDAMPDGGTLSIETSPALLQGSDLGAQPDIATGKYIRVSVTDTGAGIPAEIIPRIFEPFFTTKGDGKGSGLGLSMVYGFVKQSGGHITIDSKIASGTTFNLYFPAAERPHGAASAASPKAHGGIDRPL